MRAGIRAYTHGRGVDWQHELTRRRRSEDGEIALRGTSCLVAFGGRGAGRARVLARADAKDGSDDGSGDDHDRYRDTDLDPLAGALLLLLRVDESRGLVVVWVARAIGVGLVDGGGVAVVVSWVVCVIRGHGS